LLGEEDEKNMAIFVHGETNMTAFQYHTDILERYPNIVSGVILAQGMQNGPTPDTLKAAYMEEQRTTLRRVGNTPLSELETLAAWRSAFRAFGVNPTKYRSAPEALLRRLTKKGDIPSINAIVDSVNMVSIRYAIPVAAFDVRALQGAVTVHFADGTERYTPLFADQVEHPNPGEVVFSDESGLVIARRWCWRQSDESATREDTSEAIFTLEALHPTGRKDVEAAMDDLLELLNEYMDGEYHSGILDRDTPKIEI
jgi:DNA/RNA-binding domain of Phe-tRNA-synthetase-like protein